VLSESEGYTDGGSGGRSGGRVVSSVGGGFDPGEAAAKHIAYMRSQVVVGRRAQGHVRVPYIYIYMFNLNGLNGVDF